MIKTQCENMVNEFAQRLAQSGLSMEQYMQFSGLTLDKLEEQFVRKLRHVLRAVLY